MSAFGDRTFSRRAALGISGGVVLGAVGAAPVRPRPPSLRLELRADPLTARFVNPGPDPVRVLKPLDGSEWGWITPHYRLTVINAHDWEARLVTRCKSFGYPYSGTAWPDDYLVTIPGGGEFTLPVGHNHDLRDEGLYRVRLEYLFAPKQDRTPGGPYPPGLWVGSLVSNLIEVRLKPRA